MKIAAPLQRLALFSALAVSALAYGQPKSTAPARPAANGQAPQAKAQGIRESHGDWQVFCQDVPAGQRPKGAPPRICEITQQQVDQKSKKPIMQVQVISNGTKAQASILVPLMVALPKGATVSIDGAAGTPLPFLTCLPGGCVAPYQLDEQKLGKLRSGKKLSVTVSGVQGQPLSAAFSLNGFAKAIQRATELTKS